MRHTIYRLARSMNALRVEAELQRLPEYLLKDIGISRCEINHVVRNGRKGRR